MRSLSTSPLSAHLSYAQAEHRRDPKVGVRLGAGKVTYKVAQKLDADLLGLSGFTYNEPIPCGTMRFLEQDP